MARGDHLFFYRSENMYSHHGIDTGEGTVIHYDSSIPAKLAATVVKNCAPRVRESTFEEFSQGRPVLTRAYATCDTADVVIRRARERVGEQSYDLFRNNCEHFAVWCKTGKPASCQTDAARGAARDWCKTQWVSLLLARSARRLPSPYRQVAFGGALLVSGASLATNYLRRRRATILAKEA